MPVDPELEQQVREHGCLHQRNPDHHTDPNPVPHREILQSAMLAEVGNVMVIDLRRPLQTEVIWVVMSCPFMLRHVCAGHFLQMAGGLVLTPQGWGGELAMQYTTPDGRVVHTAVGVPRSSMVGEGLSRLQHYPHARQGYMAVYVCGGQFLAQRPDGSDYFEIEQVAGTGPVRIEAR